MVNANLVISVSAVLVALILTIVLVMRQAGDPTDNYSVTVTGSFSKDSVTYPADMYFCTGSDCQFFDVGKDDNFPGYFALVGFVDPASGNTFVTEHSIKKTFTFSSAGTLLSCHEAEALDVSALTQRVDELTSSFKASGSLEVEGSVYTIASYSMNSKPASDVPSVVGRSIPSPEECQIVNGETFVDVVNPLADNKDFGARRRTSDEERRLGWNDAAAQNADTFAKLASAAYDGVVPSGWTIRMECIQANAIARFIYKEPTMVLSYAGTNDLSDAWNDIDMFGHAVYHKGFHDYVLLTKTCVDEFVTKLNGEGIVLDYITGHSLGGAAATVYKQLSKNAARVVTYGAPKTSKLTSCGAGTSTVGTRVFNEYDPVASNGMGALGSFNHDVTTSKICNQVSTCTDRSWWGYCNTWGESYTNTGAGCNQVATGCDWLADCMYYVGRHSLSNYLKHNLAVVAV